MKKHNGSILINALVMIGLALVSGYLMILVNEKFAQFHVRFALHLTIGLVMILLIRMLRNRFYSKSEYM